MPTPKVLVAGFGPFPGAPRNPSGELARNIAHSKRAARTGAKIVGIVIPTVYKEVFSTLSRALKTERPDIVLLFGLAGGTPWMQIETRAANIIGIHPDAAAEKPSDRSLIPGGMPFLNARAPAQRLVAAARKASVTARLSADAGRYICNAAFFHALHSAQKTGAPKLVAFVHIPSPRGRRPGKRRTRKIAPPSFAALQRAGEEVLLTLIAAARD
jgi:pyroglutamyl-peptidase